MPAADLLPAVAAIAAEAGALALGRWRGDFAQWQKRDTTPVCEIDLAVDVLLRQRLSALLPDAGWLSEETADHPDRLARSRVWVVDPIDGTRDYVRGREGWCVSIALVEDGRAVLGVLDAPAHGVVWHAVVGGGAFRSGQALHVGAHDRLAGARVPTDALSKVDAMFTCVARPNSIALRIAKVAADEADLAATLRWGHEWDIAAAALIAQEAGATVTDALGKPLHFNKPDPCAFGVLATTPGLHDAAVAHLSERAAVIVGA